MADFLEYSEADHKYYRNGIEIPSVTQILKHAGLVSEHSFNEEARWRGGEVHRICAADQTDGGVDLRTISPRFRPYLKAWRKYKRDAAFLPMRIEERVDSATGGGYAGRFDCVGLRQAGRGGARQVILDIKSGTIPKCAGLQLAAYGHAFAPGIVFERVAVALRPDGTYNVVVYPMAEYQNDVARFAVLVQNYHSDSSLGESK